MYCFVKDHKKEFPVIRLCDTLGLSTTAYYNYANGKSYVDSQSEIDLKKKVKEIFYFHKKRYGAARILADLLEQGYNIGIYKVRSLMKKQGLQALQSKRFVPKTTQSHPNLRRSPNMMLEEKNQPKKPNAAIVGDITYLPCREENGYFYWLYLSVWMDLFSRKIVGWHVDENMEEALVIQAFQMFLRNRNPKVGLIVHSDGGGQYGSIKFRTLIKENSLRQSMTRKNNHYDNAHIESLFGRFKTEMKEEIIFKSLEHARFKVFEYIEGYYNTIRRHSSLGQISPNVFEDRFWKNYNETKRD